MRLEIEAHRRAKDVVVGLHEPLFVCVGLQVLCSIFDGLQTTVLGSLNVKLSREVGTQCTVQAGMVA